MENKNILFGLYDDEEILLTAVKQVRTDGHNIWDVFTPFPVHGLDPLMGLQESRLHISGFIFGMIGTLTAFGFMTWVFTRDWPIIFGGKPYFSAPSFIPITFEITVLFASIGMVTAFYMICGMGPGAENPILDNRITDDKFCIAFETNGLPQAEIDKIRKVLVDTGASEIHTKTI